MLKENGTVRVRTWLTKKRISLADGGKKPSNWEKGTGKQGERHILAR